MFCDPGELRRREAGENDVAGERAKARIGIECRGLDIAPGVVPEDAGAQDLVGGIDERCAVHLAGKADALDRS